MDSLSYIPNDLWVVISEWVSLREISRLWRSGSKTLIFRLESTSLRNLQVSTSESCLEEDLLLDLQVLRRLRTEKVTLECMSHLLVASFLLCSAATARKSLYIVSLSHLYVLKGSPTWQKACRKNLEEIHISGSWLGLTPSLHQMFEEFPVNLKSLRVPRYSLPEGHETRLPKTLLIAAFTPSVCTLFSLYRWIDATLGHLTKLQFLDISLSIVDAESTIDLNFSRFPSLTRLKLEITTVETRIPNRRIIWNIVSPSIASLEVWKTQSQYGPDACPLLLNTPGLVELSLVCILYSPSIWDRNRTNIGKNGPSSLKKLSLHQGFLSSEIASHWPPNLTSLVLSDTSFGEVSTEGRAKSSQFPYSKLPPLLEELRIFKPTTLSTSGMNRSRSQLLAEMNTGMHNYEPRSAVSFSGNSGPYRLDGESCEWRTIPCPNLRILVITDGGRGASVFPSALPFLPPALDLLNVMASSDARHSNKFVDNGLGGSWTDEAVIRAIRGSKPFVSATAPYNDMEEDESKRNKAIMQTSNNLRVLWERRADGNPTWEWQNFGLKSKGEFKESKGEFKESKDEFKESEEEFKESKEEFEENNEDLRPTSINLNRYMVSNLFGRIWEGYNEKSAVAAFEEMEKSMRVGRWSSPAWNFNAPLPSSIRTVSAHGCFNVENSACYIDGPVEVTVEATSLAESLNPETDYLIPFIYGPFVHPLPSYQQVLLETSKKHFSSDFTSSSMDVDLENHLDRFNLNHVSPEVYSFWAIRSIDIWESLSTHLVTLNLDRMERADIRSLLRKTHGFRSMTALRRLRVCAGEGNCSLLLATLPIWLEEVVWDAGETLFQSNPFLASTMPWTTPTSAETLKAAAALDKSHYLNILGRMPTLWDDIDRKSEISRLVCRVSAVSVEHLEELVKWRMPKLKELRMMPLKTAKCETERTIEKEGPDIFEALVYHLEVLVMIHCARSNNIHNPWPQEKTRQYAKHLLRIAPAAPMFQKPIVKLIVGLAVNEGKIPTERESIGMQSIKTWMKFNLPNSSFDSFSIGNSGVIFVPHHVKNISMVDEDNPLMEEIAKDFENPGSIFAPHKNLDDFLRRLNHPNQPILSIRPGTFHAEPIVLHWPKSLTKVELLLPMPTGIRLTPLPDTLKVLHIYDRMETDQLGAGWLLGMHQLEDLFTPLLSLLDPQHVSQLPPNAWRIVCQSISMYNFKEDELWTEDSLRQHIGHIPHSISILQLNGFVIKDKKHAHNGKRRQETDPSPIKEARGPTSLPTTPIPRKKKSPSFSFVPMDL